ncbi:MAG: DNA primase [Tenericutes bacterium]|nr:MAG: DNA primase [Mycoplasmatota bacterium]
MSVSPQKKIFKCFTCGAGGGIISFVQNYEGISFIDSLKKISSKYDIDYKQFITDKKQIIDHKKDKIIEINYTAQEFFKFTLESMLNNFEHPVVKYLAERNLTHEDIDTFNIGYAPKDDSLINFLVGKGFTEAEIVNAGLAREVDYKIRNYFFDRIIFPIEDANGRVVGFSGRTTTGSGPKYLNSPETRAFKKTEILYNFNKARSPASLKKFLVVVEGFMDSIALHKAGVKNVVATMGTAFSETHQKNIKSIAKNIILLFDNDKAGFKTTIDVGSKLLTQGFVIKVLVPEGSKDVDEFIEKNGEKALLALFSKTYEFLNYYFDSILSNMTDDSIDYEKIREYLSLVSKETDSMKREAETNKLLNKFPNLDQEQIKSHVNALSKIKVTDVPRQVIEKPRKSRKNQEKIQIIDQRILKNEIKIL